MTVNLRILFKIVIVPRALIISESKYPLWFFEKHLCYQGSHYEKYGLFRYVKEAITCNHQINVFTVSKDEWNTKKDTGKSIKNAVHVLWYAKRHLLGWSNVEQWLVTLAVSELH